MEPTEFFVILFLTGAFVCFFVMMYFLGKMLYFETQIEAYQWEQVKSGNWIPNSYREVGKNEKVEEAV